MTPPSPFFSVIIPTLNEEKVLPRLLADLTNQDFKNFEVIVVDAKSNDQTISKAKKFLPSLPRLTVLLSRHKNVSHQRNLGSQKARGPYLVFFDADNQIPPKFLFQIHSYISHHHNVDFLTTWINPDILKVSYIIVTATYNFGLYLFRLLGKPGVSGYNMIISKKAFTQSGGFNPNLSLGEDFELSIRLHKLGFALHILKDPRLTNSQRRLEREGLLRPLKQYFAYNLEFIFKGPSRKHFDYQMGGKAHE